ncbi:MAG: Hsp20/alpha crystallin family protein [Microcoleaceae cyanobacterium]
MQETPENYILRIIVPGLNKEDLKIEATKQVVAISGKIDNQELAEDNKYLYSEFPVGKFSRVIYVPKPIVNTEVKADDQNGIVTIILPKTLEGIKRVVKVNLMASQERENLEAKETKKTKAEESEE